MVVGWKRCLVCLPPAFVYTAEVVVDGGQKVTVVTLD